MRKLRRVSVMSAIAACAIVMTAGWARAETPNACVPRDDLLEAHMYLRSLSLDLRGDLPKPDELAAIDSAADPIEQVRVLEREWLESDEFAARVVRRHRDLLWNNISNQALVAVNHVIGANNVPLDDGTPATKAIYIRPSQRSLQYRGIAIAGVLPRLTQQIPCLPILQSELEAMTQEELETKFGAGVVVGSRNGIRYVDVKNPLSKNDATNKDTLYHREGYVEMRPFWAPTTTIAICAFDAQTREVAVDGVNRCDDQLTAGDVSCGCGPDVRFCGTGATQTAITTSMTKAIELQVRDIVLSGGSYYDLFLSPLTYVNGPMAYFYRYQTGVYNRLDLAPVPLEEIPADIIDFTKVNEWRLVSAGPRAAGVLTAPGYLLRFQTNRARANRFFDKFLCMPFQAPTQGLPSPDDPCSAEPDLQKRCGCNYCHVTLEPAAAHWSRWAEAGAAFMSSSDYPKVRQDCLACANGDSTQCSRECRLHYHVSSLMSGDPYLGMFNGYLFIKDADHPNIEEGPKLLVLSSIVDGTMQECTAKMAFEWLLGRQPSGEKDDAWVEQIVSEFTASGYDYKQLVRSIVESDNYRRVP